SCRLRVGELDGPTIERCRPPSIRFIFRGLIDQASSLHSPRHTFRGCGGRLEARDNPRSSPMIYSAVRRHTTARGGGTHEIRQPWVLPSAETSSAFTKRCSRIISATHHTRMVDATGT